MQVKIGMCFPRELPAPLIATFATALDGGGADDLWVIEDCFYTAGISLAATALARSERLTVGIGILPAVARNPAITAMEIATLAQLAPGRVIAGIGHGVQEWMGQMGVRRASPLAALEETLIMVGRLLDGENVTFDGDTWHLNDVELSVPPVVRPPILAGVRGPKSMAIAGRCADGVVLAEFSGPTAVRAALAAAGNPSPFAVAVFAAVHIDGDRRTAREWVAPWLAAMVATPPLGLRQAPFFADLVRLIEQHGPAGLVTMPNEWWTELAAVGTPDDVLAHIDALASAGVDRIGLFPSPEPDVALTQLALVTAHLLNPPRSLDAARRNGAGSP